MNKLGRRYRALPIRARLAALVAAAVAFAVAAVSVTCWFIVERKLYDQLDRDLQKASSPQRLGDTMTTLESCPQKPSQSDIGGFRIHSNYYQLVKRNGTACVFANSAGRVKTTSADIEVIAEESVRDGIVHQSSLVRTGTDSDGNAVRVLTQPLTITQGPGTPPQLYPDTALQVAIPLKNTQNTLNDLALILLLVSGIGVIGAGAAGLAVARAGLRPVDKLTEAVEHVARTEDLSVRIPVEDESEDEVARLSRSFNSMTTALASSRDLQQQLIADAGHELRTPLTSLRTNIELLTRSEETGRPLPPEDRKALLASVKAQMTELAALIGDLQELSRSEGQRGERVQVVSFQDTVEAALRRARLRGPELTITADLEPWFVRAEPSALERAIVNILDNAVKFSPEGGTIEVQLTDGALTVRDHGPGIPADELPHVFDRFWRSPSARALPGSGLGLSIVARTVQQAGGKVTLARAEGGGTVATVRLPGAATAPPEAV
ncbi:sensor histidine kinase [Streptomyces diastatochromogenes]|uniref:histidine kinase n=1 Tax=Streptomyces diastatochromogenes TaxID=42236 RepID=A0A233SIE2_STRDA|nr:HAMP domain-containing sensor histidine kinase [Streptomyces diastatochromogenes]MCZ0988451.1 HAMP domain-containing sensor histidine kinase [Streptomyces diastatochromogenes]OXY95412.1 two-component sensor histidine kinase [Streptomyces diastatochromogenes]